MFDALQCQMNVIINSRKINLLFLIKRITLKFIIHIGKVVFLFKKYKIQTS